MVVGPLAGGPGRGSGRPDRHHRGPGPGLSVRFGDLAAISPGPPGSPRTRRARLHVHSQHSDRADATGGLPGPLKRTPRAPRPPRRPDPSPDRCAHYRQTGHTWPPPAPGPGPLPRPETPPAPAARTRLFGGQTITTTGRAYLEASARAFTPINRAYPRPPRAGSGGGQTGVHHDKPRILCAPDPDLLFITLNRAYRRFWTAEHHDRPRIPGGRRP